MKKASEYARNGGLTIHGGKMSEFMYDTAVEIIKQAQQDAIEATLALAAKRTTLKRIKYDNEIPGLIINKESILSLKDELFKQLE